jgi:hypothetical protein
LGKRADGWPGIEWFVQTALQVELADNVEIGRLYTDYRRYCLGQRRPVRAEDQLRMLTGHADHYHQLMRGAGPEPLAPVGNDIICKLPDSLLGGLGLMIQRACTLQGCVRGDGAAINPVEPIELRNF